MEEILGAIIAAAIIAAAIAVPYKAILWAKDMGQCGTIHRLTGLKVDVTLSTGCLVYYRGEWVDGDVVTKHKQDVTVRDASRP